MAEDTLASARGDSVGLSPEQLAQIRILLHALCLTSRNLPLPESILRSVNSFSHSPPVPDAADSSVVQGGVLLLPDKSQTANLDSLQRVELEDMQAESEESCEPLCAEDGNYGTPTSLEGAGLDAINLKGSTKKIGKRHEMSDLLEKFEETLMQHRTVLSSSATLRAEMEHRLENKLTSRLSDLEDKIKSI